MLSGSIFQPLHSPANAALGTLRPFLLSGVVAVWSASCVVYLQHLSAGGIAKWLARHPSLFLSFQMLLALPVLSGAPITVGSVLHGLGYFGPVELGTLQNDCSVAITGYVLFTFLAYVLLEFALKYSDSMLRAQGICRNMQGEPWMRRLLIFALTAVPTWSLCLAILLVLQNSMFAATSFLGYRTPMFYLIQSFSHIEGSLFRRAGASFILISFIGIVLVAAYYVPFMVTKLMLVWQSQRRRGNSMPPRFLALLPKCFQPLAVLTVAFMACVFLGVLVALVVELGQAFKAGEIELRGPLNSMIKPGPCIAMILSGTIWLMAIAYRCYRVNRWKRRWIFNLAVVFAFVPSTLYGSIVLPLLTGHSRFILVIATVSAWAGGLFVFFTYAEVFSRPYMELVNLRLSKRGFRRLPMAVMLSRLGGLLPAAVITAYLLWVEDGLQNTLGVDGTLSTLLYRGATGEWSRPLLAGVFVCMLIWVCGVLASVGLRKMFIGFARNRWGKASTVAVGMSGLLVLAAASFASAQSLQVDFGSRTLALGGKSKSLHFDSAVIDNESVVDIVVSSSLRSLVFEKLVVRTARPPQIRVVGANLQNFEIKKVEFKSETSRPLLLSFRQSSIGYLRIDGDLPPSNQGVESDSHRVEVEFDSDSHVDEALLRSIRLSSVALRLNRSPGSTGSPHRIELIGVQASKIDIRGPDSMSTTAFEMPGRDQLKPSAVISINASLVETSAAGIPEIELSQLVWLGGSITAAPVMPEKGVIVQFRNVDYEADELGEVNLESFETAEFRWTNGLVNGRVAVRARDLRGLELDHLKKASGGKEADIEVKADEFDSVGLSQLNLSALRIEGGSAGSDDWYFTVLKSIYVDDRISVPRSFLISAAEGEGGGRTVHIRNFMSTLQDFGVYSETDSPVGLDAVYHRNLAAIRSISAPAAVLLDWFTGLGVALRKPVVAWAIYTFAYVILFCILWGGRKPIRGLLVALGSPVFGFMISDDKKGLLMLVTLYRAVFVVQVSAVTIYLGQTVLSLP